MEFREFRKEISSLRPEEGGFRKKALPRFKNLLKEMGLKDEEQATKIANQVAIHFKVNAIEGKATYSGDLLKDAFTKAIAPTSISKPDLETLKEALKDEELSWKIDTVSDSISDSIKKGEELDLNELPDLRVELKKTLPCVDNLVAQSAVSRSVIAHIAEGNGVNPEEVLKHYTGVNDPPKEFKKKLRNWLEGK